MLNSNCSPFYSVNIRFLSLDYSLSEKQFLLCFTFVRKRQHMRVKRLLSDLHITIFPEDYFYLNFYGGIKIEFQRAVNY